MAKAQEVHLSLGPSVCNLLLFLYLKYAKEGHFSSRKGIWSSFHINTILLPWSNSYVKLPLGDNAFESTPSLEIYFN